ncbi:MAG: sulfopyruvate decarboxylase TPP-binding subunit [Verrucomicrobiales bacterium]|jgi:sulfopyruvate decarboxylase TPP-binding subunit
MVNEVSVTKENGVSSVLAVAELLRLGFTDIVMIPDSESAPLFNAAHASDDLRVISPTREGEGIAIAAGLWVGGRKPLVVLQNTGLMEGGDALRGCGIGPHIPLRLMVGWRGYGGAQAGALPIDSAQPFTEPLLDAWKIPTLHLMNDDDLANVAIMDDTSTTTSLPAALLTGWAFR